MSIKIKGCTECWASYTWETWQVLKLIRVETPDNAQTRECEKCSAELTVDVEHLETLDIRTPLEMLVMDNEKRDADRRRVLLDRVRAAAAVFGVSVVVVVSVAMWWN